jgi:trehalose 6-phosphate synthase/phosphatase
MDRLWIGWAGTTVEDETEQTTIAAELKLQGMLPVFLSDTDVTNFYDGFSNKTIWPHFHYFTQYTQYSDEYWESYSNVNRRFAEVVGEAIQPDDVVWIHDYQLMLVPGLLRATFPTLSIGFFLHIPFPSYELFRTLPWRYPILQGILGADMIGFHTFDYMRHFLSSVYRIIGYEHTFGRLDIDGRIVKVDAMPMGIDYAKYAEHTSLSYDSNPEVKSIQETSQKVKLILSVDRLDYSKGIPQRIRAYESFLRSHKEYIGKVTLVAVVVPSRTTVGTYAALKEEIDVLVGAVNGELGTFDWVPIRYFYRAVAFDSLSALYRSSHIALITPLRDGMNLVAKEFVASKDSTKLGVLILSEMTGAANELDDAVIVNPCDSKNIIQALLTAMEMPEHEQMARMSRMQKTLKENDVKRWASCFIDAQIELQSFQKQRETQMLGSKKRHALLTAFESAGPRLLLLDVGGTLTRSRRDPRDAYPDSELLTSLEQLAKQPETVVVVISGRDSRLMTEWFGKTGVDMVAEHGAMLYKNGNWTPLHEGMDTTWMPDFRSVLEKLVKRTAGSFIEEKDYTLAWHYSTVEHKLGLNHLREIRGQLMLYSANHMTSVIEGRGVVEIRNADINKGKACSTWIQSKEWGFILAVGDDDTDEDMFESVPSSGVHCYTVRVGMKDTKAKYKVSSVFEIRSLIHMLATKDPVYVPRCAGQSPLTPLTPADASFTARIPFFYSLPLPLKITKLPECMSSSDLPFAECSSLSSGSASSIPLNIIKGHYI